MTSLLAPLMLAALLCGAAQAQQHHHLQSLQQAHLPQDPNVIAATQVFLQQFAAHQAQTLAAAPAPDQSVHRKVTFQSGQPVVQTTQAPHNNFAHHLPEEPINAAIRQLHQALKRTGSPNENQIPQSSHQQQHFQQQPHQQFQQQPHQQFQQQPNNQLQMNLFHQPSNQHQQHQQQQQPQQQQQQQVFHHPSQMSPIHNQFGHVINPNRFPGPLADDVPAAVGGPVQQVGPTAAVHQAQQQLAQAHMAILAHHATLPQTPAPQKNNKNNQG